MEALFCLCLLLAMYADLLFVCFFEEDSLVYSVVRISQLILISEAQDSNW